MNPEPAPAVVLGVIAILTAAGAVMVKVISATKRNGNGNGYGPEMLALYRSIGESLRTQTQLLERMGSVLEQLREENANYHREGRDFMASSSTERARLAGIAEGLREAERRRGTPGEYGL